jgi:hypothetical protein
MEWEKIFLNKKPKLHFGRKIQRQSLEGEIIFELYVLDWFMKGKM